MSPQTDTSAILRVAVTDDDPFVVESLTTILNAQPDVEVVGQTHSGIEAETLYADTLPDVLLMDIQMPESDGLSAAEHIIAQYPNANIVFLTTFYDDEYIVRALRLGARGYLIKQNVGTIAPALRAVNSGQHVLGEEVLERLDMLMGTEKKDAQAEPSDEKQRAFTHPDLTPRECSVVEYVAEGLDNKEIAARMFLSEGTVRNHISAILQKLLLKNRTQLAVFYFKTLQER